MPHADLPQYQAGFFETFLAGLPDTPTLATLQAQQPDGLPLSLEGEYQEYSGDALTPIAGGSVTPQFAVESESGGSARTYPLLWLIERYLLVN